MTAAAGRREAPHSPLSTAPLAEADREVFASVEREVRRQHQEIELIASENFVSRAVLEAAGTVLTNKYAEGYPGNRYYGGCQYVDEIETLAIERAKKLFKCNFANVQPHSGSTANQAAFMAMMKPGDIFMGLSLDTGGHLTHGSPVKPVGQVVQGRALQSTPPGSPHRHGRGQAARPPQRPKVIVAGGSAYPRIIDFAAFRAIADEVGAC